MPQNTDICKECGHEYGIHSTDGERCPKNRGQLINGQLDFYATHFDDGLYGTDQLRAKIDEQAATIARLISAEKALQGEMLIHQNIMARQIGEIQSLQNDRKLADMAWTDNQAVLKAQAAEIAQLTAKLSYAYEALERVK